MYLKGNIEKYLKIGYLNSEPFNYSLRESISLVRKYFKDWHFDKSSIYKLILMISISLGKCSYICIKTLCKAIIQFFSKSYQRLVR